MLIRADARAIPLKDETVQTVVTSPPYWGQRLYLEHKQQIGLECDYRVYIEQIRAVFREVRRVLKHDGITWLVMGDAYYQGNKGNSGELKLSDKQATNVHSLATRRGPQLSPSRRGGCPGLKPKDLIGLPWRVALSLQDDGWWLRQEIIWHKPGPMTESVKDRPTTSHEHVFLLSKSKEYFYNYAEVKEPANPENWRKTRTLRKSVPPNQKSDQGFKHGRVYADRNLRSVWTIPRTRIIAGHPATFPEELAETCIRAGSRSGDVVCDPFVGSGTVVSVARRLGRIGIGLDLTYQELAAERVGGPLFASVVNSAWGSSDK